MRRRTARAVAWLSFVLFVGMGGICSDYSVAAEQQGPPESQNPGGLWTMFLWCGALVIVLAGGGFVLYRVSVMPKKENVGRGSGVPAGISKKMDAKRDSPSSRFGGKSSDPPRGSKGGSSVGADPSTRDKEIAALHNTIRDILREVLPGEVKQCRAEVTFTPDTAEGIAKTINHAALAENGSLRGKLEESLKNAKTLTTEKETIEGNLAEMTVKGDIFEKRLENLVRIVPKELEDFLAQQEVLPLSGSSTPESVGAVLALISLHQAATAQGSNEKKADDVRACFMRLDDLLYRALASQPDALHKTRLGITRKVNDWMNGTSRVEWPAKGDPFNQEVHSGENIPNTEIRIAKTAIIRTPEGELVRKAFVETEPSR